jgi:hypothetical protein
MHKTFWVPAVQAHFVCGLGFNTIRLLRPLRPDMPFYCRLVIEKVEPKPDRSRQVVHWRYNLIEAETDELLCFLEIQTYHIWDAELSPKFH